MKTLIFIFSILFFCAHNIPVCFAQNASDDPIEILAQESLEWDRDNQIYKALGGATAKQGDFVITSDAMDASYKEDQSNLTFITARDNVVITNLENKATGDKLIYDVAEEQATLTGNNLRFTGNDLDITAKDRFIYNRRDSSVSAIGKAFARQTADDQDIRADRLTADFDAQNNLKTITAKGSITMTAGEDIITGDNALYDARNQTAEVTGENVTLTRGPNILTGDKVTVDLNNNVSRLFGQPDKPATAVFFPGTTRNDSP